MQVIENLKVKEKLYKEKLDNGLTVMIIPKKGIQKKYIIWGTNYGSNDSVFVVPGENEATTVPNGVAHFLEHKLFEQENGTNSLDTLTSIGVEANAYTTNDHTAYLYECTDNFYEALDEFMDYVQHPYFTDENVEKEKGIIGQEIMMYDDDPGFQLYLNTLKCLYSKCPIRIDIAGSIDSIAPINPDILYKCYNTFYNPSNMVLVVCGNFEPQNILEEIKKRLKSSKNIGEIHRIYEEEPKEINEKHMEKSMSVSMPIFMIGVKDKIVNPSERVRRHMAIEVILNLLIGKSSNLYKKLYEEQILLGEADSEYEFSNQYAHILISGQSNNPQLVQDMLITEIEKLKNNGFVIEDFERVKRKIYGEFVTEFNDVASISRMFLADTVKQINSFDYVDEYDNITMEYAKELLNEVFVEDKMVLSVIKNKVL